MAGRAGGETLASYMESANEAADTETQEQEAAKPGEDCEEVEKSEKVDHLKGNPALPYAAPTTAALMATTASR